jgi:hypothetical protein
MNFSNQLLQYIGGVVGIDKTQIIKAIKGCFLKTNKEDKLRIATCTTNVALLIGGMNVHSLFGLLVDKNMIINKPKQYHIVGLTFNL